MANSRADDYNDCFPSAVESYGQRAARHQGLASAGRRGHISLRGDPKLGKPEKFPFTRNLFDHQYDSDCLELCKFLVEHFEVKPWKRPMYESMFTRAIELLGIHRWLDPSDRKLKWRCAGDWRQRLTSCGVDPTTFHPVNPDRWSRAWEQLRDWYELDILKIEKDIAGGIPAPSHRHFTWSQRRKGRNPDHWQAGQYIGPGSTAWIAKNPGSQYVTTEQPIGRKPPKISIAAALERINLLKR